MVRSVHQSIQQLPHGKICAPSCNCRMPRKWHWSWQGHSRRPGGHAARPRSATAVSWPALLLPPHATPCGCRGRRSGSSRRCCSSPTAPSSATTCAGTPPPAATMKVQWHALLSSCMRGAKEPGYAITSLQLQHSTAPMISQQRSHIILLPPPSSCKAGAGTTHSTAAAHETHHDLAAAAPLCDDLLHPRAAMLMQS